MTLQVGDCIEVQTATAPPSPYVAKVINVDTEYKKVTIQNWNEHAKKWSDMRVLGPSAKWKKLDVCPDAVSAGRRRTRRSRRKTRARKSRRYRK